MIGQTISHYRITAELGSGGMGTVYRADDLKLDRTVALKFLAPGFLRDGDAKARFVHEAKAASALDHPNICTIHAIEETDDGSLFIAMACYEGETVKDMTARGPLPVAEAVEITVQVAQGLAKAHSLGIVHRDIKPANVFVTEDGLVKLLDFGIAKLAGATQVTRTGAVLGTVHSMAPEQVQGGHVDRRSDVWSLGVLLYEMLAGKPPFTGESAQAVAYAIVNAEPAALGTHREDVPADLQLTVDRCLRKTPNERPESMDALLHALRPLSGLASSRLTLSRTASQHTLADARGVQPYPGLASFSEADAEYFHGRESQVEAVWQQLRHERLLAVAGPSGVGKTSFLRAGLIPARPQTWGILVATPGGSPFLSLREALVRKLSGDTEAIVGLLREDDQDTDVATVRRWRMQFDEALLVLDQFEELFTLSPPEEQARFAELLSRLVFEADVRVLVSLRDDFLFHCQEYAGLAPVVHSLTLLTPLAGPALRRALMQPALDCGYGFDDEALVGEMTAAVEGERGALPLLAFTMARLWDERDRDQGLLTRETYGRIGAVGGALARHAESVMERIGAVRQTLVRELFRNLVTSQGTRAVLDREQLLSVFPAADRSAADGVLAGLIDARLLTSYEIKGEDGRQHHRVEIVHESLLSAWPRLVRWQTQDADSAQLRDQLRQAAQLWEQKDRTDDLLWTGTAYQEFELWRDRYPGGLSASEESFAAAMAVRATRRRRRRRLAVGGVFVALLAVLAIVGNFWQRADRLARVSEARRFHMLAKEQVAEDPTVALALATASLEREDDPDVRRLALQALWKAPCRFVLQVPDTLPGAFWPARLSPDGRWLAAAGRQGVHLWPANGSAPRILRRAETPVPYQTWAVQFEPSGSTVYGTAVPLDIDDWESPAVFTRWSLPDGRQEKHWQPVLSDPTTDSKPLIQQRVYLVVDPLHGLVASLFDRNQPYFWQRYLPDEDRLVSLGLAPTDPGIRGDHVLDPSGRFLIDQIGDGIYRFTLDSLQTTPPELIGRHEGKVFSIAGDFARRRVAGFDMSGEIRIWSLDGGAEPLFRQRVGAVLWYPVLSPSGKHLVAKSGKTTRFNVFDLGHPGAEPLETLPNTLIDWRYASLAPDDSWLVLPRANSTEIWFLPLTGPFPTVWPLLPDTLTAAEGQVSTAWPARVLEDNKRIVVSRAGGELWVCDLFSSDPQCRQLFRHPAGEMLADPVSDATGRFLLGANAGNTNHAWLIPLDGSPARTLGEFHFAPGKAVALSADGRRAAVAARVIVDGIRRPLIRIWNLETFEERVLEPSFTGKIWEIWFLSGNRLLASSEAGLHVWDLATGRCEALDDHETTPPQEWWLPARGSLDASGRFLLVDRPDGISLWDLQRRTRRSLPIPSNGTASLAISPDGRHVAAGRSDGEVFVLANADDTPHVLLGHEGTSLVWFAPGGDEICSAGVDGTVRVWDLPAGPPLHARPHDELLEILRAQTNLRVVSDVDSAEGYRMVYDRFPGWQTTPAW